MADIMDQYQADFRNYFKSLFSIPICLFWLYLIRPLYFISLIYLLFPQNKIHYHISTGYEFAKVNLPIFIATILDPRNKLNKFTYYVVMPALAFVLTALIAWLYGKLP